MLRFRRRHHLYRATLHEKTDSAWIIRYRFQHGHQRMGTEFCLGSRHWEFDVSALPLLALCVDTDAPYQVLLRGHRCSTAYSRRNAAPELPTPFHPEYNDSYWVPDNIPCVHGHDVYSQRPRRSVSVTAAFTGMLLPDNGKQSCGHGAPGHCNSLFMLRSFWGVDHLQSAGLGICSRCKPRARVYSSHRMANS